MNNAAALPVKIYNPIYKVIHNYEFILPVVATAGIGFVSFGSIGLSFGAFGAIDVAAKYFEIYDRPYLTSSVLGYGLLSSFKSPSAAQYFGNREYFKYQIDPSLVRELGWDEIAHYLKTSTWLKEYIYSFSITDVIGITVGLIAPTGILDDHIEKITAPASGAISGYSYAGVYGAGIGITLGVIDESLSAFNLTHGYPLTSTLSNIATINLLIPQAVRASNYIITNNLGATKTWLVQLIASLNSLEITNIIAASSLEVAFFSEQEKTKSTALQLREDLYQLYSQIIPKSQLDDLIEKQLITLVASQIMLAKIDLKFTRYNQDFDKSFANLVKTDAAFLEFVDKLSIFSLYLIPYIGGILTNKYIDEYFKSQFTYLVRDQIEDELLNNQVLLHVKQNSIENALDNSEKLLDAKVLLDKMPKDISKIAGSALLTDAMSNAIKGSYAVGHLFSINAIDTLLYSSVYNYLVSKLTYIISLRVDSFQHKIDDLSSKMYNKYKHFTVNAVAMTINNANAFAKEGYNELKDELRTAIDKQKDWKAASKAWSTAQRIINIIFNILVVANQIAKGDLDSDKRDEVISMTQEFSSMISWDANNFGSIIKLQKSIGRILELKARMREVEDQLEHQPNYHYEMANQVGICFNDFKVGKNNESRLHINDLCVFDKVIAVTSASGGGKSTLYEAIGKIIHGESWSEGDITYFTKDSKSPYIVMTSQQRYIPPEDSLLEFITFKKGLAAEPYRQKVIELLTKIKIDNVKVGEVDLISNLDVKKDWNIGLSSEGQYKKIMLARLILDETKPSHILFDELFSGVDPSSIKDLQKILSEEFPDTQIFNIDHELKAHNDTGWYNNELHLEGGTAWLQGASTALNALDEGF